jgi:S-DNA-T family DNA segregation ATPase FtsK/SpoIIIE
LNDKTEPGEPLRRRGGRGQAATPEPSRHGRLLAEARWIVGALAVVALASVLATYTRSDPGFSHTATAAAVANLGGRIGAWVADVAHMVLGYSSWLVVVAGLAWVVRGFRRLHAPYAQQGLPDWVQAAGFLVLLFGCAGLEAHRLQWIAGSLPQGAGGVLGAAVAGALQAGLGFTGATLALLAAIALGASLFFDFSWIAVAERTGVAFEGLFARLRERREVQEDRAIGEAALVERDHLLQTERERIEETLPIHIERPPPRVKVSERKLKEKQVPLFAELADARLPTLDLLDEAPADVESIATDTLEFTSRLIEKKLKDFGVEAAVVAAYPGPVVTRYEI